jgi:hypothetical protein
MDKYQGPSIFYLQENHITFKDKDRLKVKGCIKILHANGNQKKTTVTTLMSDKADFNSEIVKRNKESHYAVN